MRQMRAFWVVGNLICFILNMAIFIQTGAGSDLIVAASNGAVAIFLYLEGN